MEAIEKIYRASKLLFDNMPFYGILSLRVRKVIDEDIPTAGINLAADNFSLEMRFNPKWIDGLSIEQVRGVIEHELLHMINGHLTEPRYNGPHIDAETMNIAMDCEINQYINRKLLPTEGVYIDELQSKLGIKLPEKAGTETYYNLLKKENPKSNDGGGISIGGHSLNTMDKHTPAKDPSAMEAVVNGVLEQAAEETIKRRGTIPGQVSQLLEKLKEQRKPVIDWKYFLRRFVANSYKEHTITTRRRESRRFEDAPGLRHEPEFNLLVGIDTSGSVSDKELKEFMQEIDNISKQKCDITILLCDTKIHSIVQYKHGMATDFKVQGRGGTSFEPVLQYYREHPDTCLVYFTDGECYLESTILKPVLWVISTQGTHKYLENQKYVKMS